MSIVRKEKKLSRLHKLAVAAALLTVGAMASGCSHPAAAPAVPPTPSAAASGAAPGATAPSATVASPMSVGDQQEMQQKQNENKGTMPPP